MKFQAFFVILLLTCMCLSMAQGSYGNCCLRYATGMKPGPLRNIESYTLQETDGDCNIRAVVFQMKRRPSHKKQRTVCANPDDSWVQDVMSRLDSQVQN